MRNLGFIVAVVAAMWSAQFSPAMAQTATTYSSSKVWGTSPCGIAVCGAAEGMSAHVLGGSVAGQVKAANMGALFTTSYQQNNYSVGVLNQSSINGSGNNMNSGQSGNNQGDTTNHGSNSMSGNGGVTTFNPF